MEGEGSWRLFEGEHAVVEAEVAEENHVIDHEAKERSQLILRRKHELLCLIVKYGIDLLLYLASLFQDKVDPWKLFLHTVVQVGKFCCVGVSVEHVDGEPASSVKFDHLKRTAAGRHCHATCHQL